MQDIIQVNNVANNVHTNAMCAFHSAFQSVPCLCRVMQQNQSSERFTFKTDILQGCTEDITIQKSRVFEKDIA